METRISAASLAAVSGREGSVERLEIFWDACWSNERIGMPKMVFRTEETGRTTLVVLFGKDGGCSGGLTRRVATGSVDTGGLSSRVGATLLDDEGSSATTEVVGA